MPTLKELVDMNGDCPEPLMSFLQKCDNETADAIWLWLDENPGAVSDMIEIVCDSHPEISLDLGYVEEFKDKESRK